MSQFTSKLAFLRWGIRGFDIVVLLADPVLGLVFALPSLDRVLTLRLLLFLGLEALFFAHIYLLNDWADAALNPQEPAARKVQAMKRPEVVSERQLLILIWALLVVSLAGLVLLSRTVFLISIAIAGLSYCYSHPLINWKGQPLVNTLIHLAFAPLSFLAGWALLQPLSWPAAAIGLFLGMVRAAGHPANEIEDFPNDSRAGIRTNAIAFGQRPVFRLGLALFLLSSLYLTALAWKGWTPKGMVWIGVALSLLWLIQTYRYRHWKGGDPIRSFRRFYRFVYALASFIILSLLLWEKWRF